MTLEKSGRFKKPITTEIVKVSPFYRAEEYHQNYHKKCSLRYGMYKKASGRDAFITQNWKDSISPSPGTYKKPSPQEIKKNLTPIQHEVTQACATEAPFQNEYWDNKSEGIYVDIVSGEPLFSSLDKFESGTGWPSFTKPLEPENIVEKEDRSLLMKRTEVKSKHADSHLGHVFDDGPKPTGKRYCMNSASLRFIKKEDLEKEGYGGYRNLFEKR